MRPKKVILCVDYDPAEVSVLTFLFKTHGYRVEGASRADEALSWFIPDYIDVALVGLSSPPNLDSIALVDQMKRRSREIPVVLRGYPAELGGRPHNGDVFIAVAESNATLLDRIKVMCARKRGPKPRQAIEAGAAGFCLVK